MPIIDSTKMQGCFRINYRHQTGTAFLRQGYGKMFFVTAKHCVKDMQVGDNIGLYKSSECILLKVRDIKYCEKGNDIAIFSVEKFSIRSQGDLQVANLPHMKIAHPAIFLGFPHGLNGNFPDQQGFVTPLSKVAFFSGVIEVKGNNTFLLDGSTNPGFSGGPVYCSCSSSGDTNIVSVVSGYRYEKRSHSHVYKIKGEDGEGEEVVKELFTKNNSNFIYTIPISVADKLSEFSFKGLDVEISE